MASHHQSYTPPSGPPRGLNPRLGIYEVMGQDNIYLMLKDFYIELGNSSIRSLFPDDLIEASKKSAAFFVFLLGGPPLYQQQYGPPMMRKRHLPFLIDETARQVWLSCFKRILIEGDKKYKFPMQHSKAFIDFLDQFSLWMVNTKMTDESST